MSDDHSELEPPLPIPNRAVKRLSADDSADYPCESRTLLGSLFNEKALHERAFLFMAVTTHIRQIEVWTREAFLFQLRMSYYLTAVCRLSRKVLGRLASWRLPVPVVYSTMSCH